MYIMMFVKKASFYFEKFKNWNQNFYWNGMEAFEIHLKPVWIRAFLGIRSIGFKLNIERLIFLFFIVETLAHYSIDPHAGQLSVLKKEPIELL